MNRSGQNHGLTLVELLVAMAVSALVMVILVQGISSLSKWSHHLRYLQENSEKTGSLFRFMQERLIRIEPLQIETEDGLQVLFSGSSEQISFVIAETTYPAKPGLYEQSLQISQTADQNWQVTLDRKPLIQLNQFGSKTPTEPLVLFSGISQPEFSFLGNDGWQPQWELTQSLPQQIAFSLENWPAIIIAIPAVFTGNTVKGDDDTPQEAKPDAN
jgi:prepilin-type N-terminal cleavage/methylation domain-containing protein